MSGPNPIPSPNPDPTPLALTLLRLLTLTLAPYGWASGKYQFESSAYFPIDNEYPNEPPDFFPVFRQVGWGNEGREHNFHFCSVIHTVPH